MFVRQSTYDAKCLDLQIAKATLTMQIKKWNELVGRINKLGGMDFIRKGEQRAKQISQFTDDELTKLIQLCHPDKHDGKPMANEMTAKLLTMKGSK